MNEVNTRMAAQTGRVMVASLAQLDAMVGEFVMGDCPEVAWQDSYGLFCFSSRLEAEEAINNNYYRLFRPDLDWEAATVQEVRHFPLYSADLEAAWSVVERLSRREQAGRNPAAGRFLARGFFRHGGFCAHPGSGHLPRGLARARASIPFFARPCWKKIQPRALTRPMARDYRWMSL